MAKGYVKNSIKNKKKSNKVLKDGDGRVGNVQMLSLKKIYQNQVKHLDYRF